MGFQLWLCAPRAALLVITAGTTLTAAVGHGTLSRNTDNLQFIKVSKVKVGLDRHIPMEIKSVLHIKAVQWKQPAKQPAKCQRKVS